MTSKKGTLLLCLFLFLAMLLIPLTAVGGGGGGSAATKNTPAVSGQQFRIRDTASGKVLLVDDRDFTRGAVAAEMSPEAPAEALKAQAVAAYTYYSRIRESKRAQGGSGADFDADPANWNIYVTDAEMQKRWGDSYAKYRKTLDGVADSVAGLTLRSGGKLADTTYFAISGGSTEDAADVWGSKCPYLVSVASPWDVFAGGYETSAGFSDSDFRARILKLASNANLSGDAAGWAGSATRSQAGTVKVITIGGQELTGEQVRGAFGLRSANFTLTHGSSGFTFTVKGYGHGVGMSQVGAEAMARQGTGFRDILAWYYPTASLT